MKNYYFLLMIFLSIFSFGQNTPFIIEVESDENAQLILPIVTSNTLIYTLKDLSGNVISGPSTVLDETFFPKSIIISDLIVNTRYELEILNKDNDPISLQLSNNVTELIQWGNNIVWGASLSLFAKEAPDLKITASDVPDFSTVSTMNAMFSGTKLESIPRINEWNTSNVINMNSMFKNSEFNDNISSWDTSKVTNMSYMFSYSKFDDDISDWDTSKVTNMQALFQGSPFTGDISKWNVSNVTNMSNMFQESPFTGDISKWNTSNVINMEWMFNNTSFNSQIKTYTDSYGIHWDVSKVENMRAMFSYSKFTNDISNWNTSSVINMSSMFQSSLFNEDISNWDTSKVTDMSFMFRSSKFNSDISKWNTSNVLTMQAMFQSSLFNHSINTYADNDGIHWDVSKVENMRAMFRTSKFNSDISNWDVSRVTDMTWLFTSSPFNKPIKDWNVSSLRIMTSMFQTSDFNQSLENWIFGYSGLIVDLNDSVIDCENLSKTFNGWYNNTNTRAIANQLIAQGLRYNRTALEAYNKLFNIGGGQINPGAWTIHPYVDEEYPDPDKYAPEYLEFCGLETEVNPFIIEVVSDENGDLYLPIFDGTPSYIYKLKQLNIVVIPDTSSVASILTIDGLNANTAYDLEIYNDTDNDEKIPLRIKLGNNAKKIKQWGSVLWNKDMSSFADGAVDLIVITDKIVTEINGVQETIPDMPELGHVTNFSYMFKNAGINVPQTELNTVFNEGKWKINHIGDWEIQSVNDMSSMFANSAFNSPLDGWEITGRVTNFQSMFANSAFNSKPFEYYSSYVISEDDSNLEIQPSILEPVDMSYMFNNATEFNQPLNNWDVSDVTNMSYMFNRALKFNQPLNKWNVSNVTNMGYMFAAADVFDRPINTVIDIDGKKYWDVSKVTDMRNMFDYAEAFNQPINNWDVSNVTDMSYMFNSASKFNQPLDNWNLASITNTSRMLSNGIFNQNLGSWTFGDQSFVLDLVGSAIDCRNLSLSLIGWNTSSNDKNIGLAARGLSYNQSASEAYHNLFVEDGHSWIINSSPNYDENCGIEYCLKPKAVGSITPNSPKMVINTLKSGNNSPAEQMSDSYNGFVSLTKGFVLPHVAKSEDIINPIEGMLIYEVEDACIKMYSPNGNTLEWSCISRTCNDSF